MASWLPWRRGGWPARTADDELTVADLTGVGIQDAAVGALAARFAGEHGVGRDMPRRLVTVASPIRPGREHSAAEHHRAGRRRRPAGQLPSRAQ